MLTMQYPWLTALYQQLARQYAQQKLHHGLLLIGNPLLGSDVLIEHLVAMLLCHTSLQAETPVACGHCKACRLIDAGNHPDLHHIRSDKQVGVDSIRQGIERVQAHAHLMGNKVLVVHAADNMTEAAANALLKTLEEPTNNTFIVLQSESSSHMLPTVLSRCQHIQLPAPNVNQLNQWLQQQQCVVSPRLQQRYRTAPLALIQQDTQQTEQQLKTLEQALEQIKSETVPEVAVYFEEDCRQAVDFLQHWLLERCKSAMPNIDDWHHIYQFTLSQQPALLHAGTNKQLIVNQLLMKIAKLNRLH